jgi:hypothetical protein
VTHAVKKYASLQRYTRYLERNREAIEQLHTWLGKMRARRPAVPEFRTFLPPGECREALAALQARARSSRAVGLPAGAGLATHELTQFLAWPPRPLPPRA